MQSRSDKFEKGAAEKPLSCYVINTKEVPPTSFVTASSNSKVVTHYQQPQTREDSDRCVSYKSMNGKVTDKHREAFAAKQTHTRLNNNNSEKIIPVERPNSVKIPSYDEAVKQQQNDSGRGRRNPPPPKTNPSSGPPKKVVIQASTSELLDCLGKYVSAKCSRYVPSLEASDVIGWLRGVDRSLSATGWQDISFIMPASVMFVYMLCRDALNENVKTVHEVKAVVLTCLYVSYSYMGNEISYPLRPFITENDRFVFWGRCCQIMNNSSARMLRINMDSQYFTTIFHELRSHGTVTQNNAPTRPTHPRSLTHSSHYMQNSRRSSRPEFGKVAMTAGGY